ncbi:MAG: GNAT family N-acetyltransferase [Bacteroidota bacterium]
MVSLAYKRATVDDLDKIYELSEEIWKPAFAPYYSKEDLDILYTGMYNDDLLTQWLSNPKNQFYFILKDQQYIGYTAVELHSHHLKLDKIYVHQSLRGSGIGSLVMKKIEDIASKFSLERIILRVNRENKPAIEFYQNRSFTITESIDFPGPNGLLYEDYLMEKKLK